MAKLSQILGSSFDSATVEPQAPRGTVLPAGIYDVEITDAEVRELKSGKGTGLSITYTVLAPEEHTNRKIFQNLNIKHENPEAEQIAQSQLSALCRTLGIGQLDDTDDLFGKTVRVRVKVRPAKGDYAESNDVTAFEAIGATPAKATAAPAAKSASKAPWQK
jgi:hypothetical protein